MKRLSDKRRARLVDAAVWREKLIERVRRCEFCGVHRASLAVHEIARGTSRDAALDQRYAVLVLCDWCHGALHRMAGDDQRALGLALLQRSRPFDYSLPSFWKLIGRNFPDGSDVRLWSRRLGFVSER